MAFAHDGTRVVNVTGIVDTTLALCANYSVQSYFGLPCRASRLSSFRLSGAFKISKGPVVEESRMPRDLQRRE